MDETNLVSVRVALVSGPQKKRWEKTPFGELPSIDRMLPGAAILQDALPDLVSALKEHCSKLETYSTAASWYCAFSGDDTLPVYWLSSALRTTFGYCEDGGVIAGSHDSADVALSDLVRANPAPKDSTADLHVVIVEPSGLGGGPDFIAPILEFLAQQGVLFRDVPEGVVVGVATDLILHVSKTARRKIVASLRDRRARKVATDWAARRITKPSILREFIERQEKWEVEEMERRLKINSEEAVRLLKALGFSRSVGDTAWVRSSRRKDKRRRERWIRHENGW